jgi:hypothetical protein
MTTEITQVQNTSIIRDAEFVRIDVAGHDESPFFISSSFKNETITDPIGGTTSDAQGTYVALGALLSVSGSQRDLSVTSFDTSVNLVGIDQTKLGTILDAGLKGSRVQIYRGFYTNNYVLSGTPVLRYTGIVTSYSLTEERIEDIDNFALTLNCSSYKIVLENRSAGRFTNDKSWQNANAGDTAMSYVANIANAYFDFGKPKTQT